MRLNRKLLKAIAQSQETAQRDIERLRKARAVDPDQLHKPMTI